MKKEKLGTRIKNWIKEYYSVAYNEAKTDKTLGNISLGVVLVGATLTLLTGMVLGPSSLAFTLGAIATCVEGFDLIANIGLGNKSSFLLRAAMVVGFTALMPVAALAEAAITKVQEHRENKRAATKTSIVDKQIIADKEPEANQSYLSNKSSYENNAPAIETSIKLTQKPAVAEINTTPAVKAAETSVTTPDETTIDMM
jgi:uncharacterized membrane protein YuzA (DUF378 family)